MDDQVLLKLQDLSRDNLEDLTIQAILQIRQDRKEKANDATLMALLSGLLIGALVAALGYLTATALT